MQTVNVLLFISLTFSCVQCWGATGHMMIAQIAKNEVLKKDPKSFQRIEKIILDMNNNTDGKSNSFIEAASWADDIREPGSIVPGFWHYVNQDYNPENVPIFQQNVTDILESLTGVAQVLSSNEPDTNLNKLIMSRLLLHFVGDLHQPLHGVSMFSHIYPQGDEGGNFIKLNFKGKNVNLHQFWDDGAFIWPYVSRPLTSAHTSDIENYAQGIQQRYPRENFNEELKKTDFKDWAKEDLDLSINVVYPPFMDGKATEISDDYVKAVYPVMEQRIALGGYRLSDLILKFFSQNNSKFLEQ